ncbi:hypothetical protein BK816_07745 [Boudabousia tangfeifanii]|uniref:Peptidase M20 dimerisation domain-containing protein n=1 Tax=Boudabousia tangfeifanii TaxID=1912795 RepID=A0A1D9MLF4_9ACTO|nr:M20/M25/M40 family metallo-hydrolase [Boudabousia tangfeifanii]AOZ73201.1 hypothetical protein BK816_07745 [Boudabousia tangfeifanii]
MGTLRADSNYSDCSDGNGIFTSSSHPPSSEKKPDSYWQAMFASDGEISKLLSQITPKMIKWRHYFYQHPELSNNEDKTAAYVLHRLSDFGVDEIKSDVAGNSVVGIINGCGEGKAILLRAEMDALPIRQSHAWKGRYSKKMSLLPHSPDISHASGHDCHIAILLGVAKILCEFRDRFRGKVILLFQAGSEGDYLKKKLNSARQILLDGILQINAPTMAFSLKSAPAPTGTLSCRKGLQFAASTRVNVAFDATMNTNMFEPERTPDPVTALASFLTQVEQLKKRSTNKDSFLAYFGHFWDRGRFNLLPTKTAAWGKIHYFDVDEFNCFKTELERIAEESANAFRCESKVVFDQHIPELKNTSNIVEEAYPVLVDVVGENNIFESMPSFKSDDFSELINEFGGVEILLGVQDCEYPKNGSVDLDRLALSASSPTHTPHFYAQDEALEVGAKVCLRMALAHLSGEVG